ncbi:hypothetical protein DSL72_008021 [Monilinia vaccinii-corymbosi]|uniref:Uncharacterized protein n=1 Tax=Monilinia vaccinii-corymbosi TaxID=61207 RepID=A0A8A3PJI8_9HELO|nr:hypothetical protein DSL72_008021 [Monilinia vaccinii-corymbosi]
MVLSSHRYTDEQPVPKRAKCTIDTGNMQGNIVSREFVEKVLEYSESNFLPLTPEEKEGGFGVTGHELIPEGAICLTWYHNKSTRVFHNMRFLISPHPQCDLIIGARSIQKDNLLGVPNLMATSNNIISPPIDRDIDDELERLESVLLKLEKIYQKKECELLRAHKDTKNNQELKELEYEIKVAKKLYEIHKEKVAENSSKKRVDQLEDELKELKGDTDLNIPSKSDPTSSGIANPNEAGTSPGTLRKRAEPSSSDKE